MDAVVLGSVYTDAALAVLDDVHVVSDVAAAHEQVAGQARHRPQLQHQVAQQRRRAVAEQLHLHTHTHTHHKAVA